MDLVQLQPKDPSGSLILLKQQQQLKQLMEIVKEQQQHIKLICNTEQTKDAKDFFNHKQVQNMADIKQRREQQTDMVQQKYPFRKRRKILNRNYLSGIWSVREQKLYLQFINKFHSILTQSDAIREQQMFKQMSLFIRSRTPAQCRSHHKKFDFSTYQAQLAQKA